MHVVDRGADDRATPCSGAIDWARRFDHMQQHTGQHVLSAAFDRVCSASHRELPPRRGRRATIDLAREVTPREIAAAEDEANRIVWEDRPVAIRFVTAEEAAALPLRKEPARAGTLRLIDVEDFDLSACGGTHVARTGGIGIIAVSGWEKFRGGSRVEFLCGVRARRRFDVWRDALAATRSICRWRRGAGGGDRAAAGRGKSLQRACAASRTTGASTRRAHWSRAAARAGHRLSIAEALLDGWDAAGLEGDGRGGGRGDRSVPWRCSPRRRRRWS